MNKNVKKFDSVSEDKMKEIEEVFIDLNLTTNPCSEKKFNVQRPKDFKIVSGLNYQGEYSTTSSGSISPFNGNK